MGFIPKVVYNVDRNEFITLITKIKGKTKDKSYNHYRVELSLKTRKKY